MKEVKFFKKFYFLPDMKVDYLDPLDKFYFLYF